MCPCFCDVVCCKLRSPEPGSRISSCPRLSDARASLRVSNTLESQVSKTLNTILRAGKPWHDLHLVAREGCERTQVSLFANSSLKLAILTISILKLAILTISIRCCSFTSFSCALGASRSNLNPSHNSSVSWNKSKWYVCRTSCLAAEANLFCLHNTAQHLLLL